MSDDGWVPAYRQMFDPDHWLAPTKEDPASRLHAWCDLLQLATHRTRQTRLPNVVIQRGELITSLRTLADRWRWHYSSVRRFLEELKTRTAIATVSETPLGTVYRIVNYERYAIVDGGKRNSKRNAERNSGETAAKQEQEVKQLTPTPKDRGRTWRFCPADWQPTDKHRALATELHVNLDREVVAFREWEFAKPKTDPDLTFNRWLRTAAERGGNGNGRHRPVQGRVLLD